MVGANGTLHQRGLFLDACLLPAMPLLCLAAGSSGSSLLLDQMVRLGNCVLRPAPAVVWLLLQALTSQWSWGQARLQALAGILASAFPEPPPVVLTSQVLGDASCTSIQHSVAANWLLKVRIAVCPQFLHGCLAAVHASGG